jgi:hypothetical protein
MMAASGAPMMSQFSGKAEERKTMAILEKRDERHIYVEQAFPFTFLKGFSACPTWIKALLFEKYSLINIMKVIAYFNGKEELFENFRDNLLQ